MESLLSPHFIPLQSFNFQTAFQQYFLRILFPVLRRAYRQSPLKLLVSAESSYLNHKHPEKHEEMLHLETTYLVLPLRYDPLIKLQMILPAFFSPSVYLTESIALTVLLECTVHR